jgi:hypothetical protein
LSELEFLGFIDIPENDKLFPILLIPKISPNHGSDNPRRIFVSLALRHPRIISETCQRKKIIIIAMNIPGIFLCVNA